MLKRAARRAGIAETVSPHGCATPTAAMRSTAARRSPRCRRRSATPTWRRRAAICTRGPTPRAGSSWTRAFFGDEEDDDICRVTPVGTLRYAIEYYAAARVVAEKFGDCIPAQFLVGHSIELALKAFLLHQGKTEKFIRRELGHDLTECLAAAEKSDFGKHVALTEHDRAMFKIFNAMYSTKDLEYIETGYRTLLPLSSLQRLARDFLLAVVAVIPTATGLMRSELGRALSME